MYRFDGYVCDCQDCVTNDDLTISETKILNEKQIKKIHDMHINISIVQVQATFMYECNVLETLGKYELCHFSKTNSLGPYLYNRRCNRCKTYTDVIICIICATGVCKNECQTFYKIFELFFFTIH